jgi:hypothetical protein
MSWGYDAIGNRWCDGCGGFGQERCQLCADAARGFWCGACYNTRFVPCPHCDNGQCQATFVEIEEDPNEVSADAATVAILTTLAEGGVYEDFMRSLAPHERELVEAARERHDARV